MMNPDLAWRLQRNAQPEKEGWEFMLRESVANRPAAREIYGCDLAWADLTDEERISVFPWLRLEEGDWWRSAPEGGDA